MKKKKSTSLSSSCQTKSQVSTISSLGSLNVKHRDVCVCSSDLTLLDCVLDQSMEQVWLETTSRQGWTMEFLRKYIGGLQEEFSSWSKHPELLQVDPDLDIDLSWNDVEMGLTRMLVHNFYVPGHTLRCLNYQSVEIISKNHMSLRMKTTTPWAPFNVGECFYFDTLICLKRLAHAKTACKIYWKCEFTKETYFKHPIYAILKPAMVLAFRELKLHL
jgi:hypothetical protein